MKTKLLVLLVILALLLATGCGGGSGAAAGFSREDLSLTVDGTAYRINTDIEQVIADLGEDYAYAEGMSCDYDGLDKTYTYEMAAFYTNPLSQGDLVNEIYTADPAVTTSRGIAVGASRQEVLAAYGDDCEDEGDRLIYRADGERTALCFDLEGETVSAIILTNQPI